jgi:hypothetical protein
METYRKRWNQRQKDLRQLLEQRQPPAEAIDLFFTQHAELHSTKLGGNADWSFEDLIFDYLDEDGFRHIPPKQDHSIAWLVWHIARIEDVTMSMLVAGKPQLFIRDEWLGRLGIEWTHTGNAMTSDEIAKLSQMIDMATNASTVDEASRSWPHSTYSGEWGSQCRCFWCSRVLE